MCRITPPRPLRSLADLQSVFVMVILPTIQRYVTFQFRGENHTKREEALAEMQAMAWQWCVRLNQQSKDPTRFMGSLATLLSRAIRAGRKLCGQEKAGDVMNPFTQQRENFSVRPLPHPASGATEKEALEALHARTLPLDQAVAIRQYFRAWIRAQPRRQRRIIHHLMRGERTADVARKLHTTPTRISKLRRQLRADWERFCTN